MQDSGAIKSLFHLFTGAAVFSSILSLASCLSANDDDMNPLSGNELDFVSYEQGETIKLEDTTGFVHQMDQSAYGNKFTQRTGWWGSVGFYETYRVRFTSTDSAHFYLAVDVDAHSSYLYVRLSGYTAEIIVEPRSSNVEPLQKNYDTYIIDGKSYNDVYTLKMFKAFESKDSPDTAKLFWNREYGAIQLLFPDGKTIIRVD